MTKGLTVSVLDLVGMHTGEPAGSAIARSVDLAQHVERLGYARFWLAEHHSIEGLACSATPVLIGHVAAATSTIRVAVASCCPTTLPWWWQSSSEHSKRYIPDESIWA